MQKRFMYFAYLLLPQFNFNSVISLNWMCHTYYHLTLEETKKVVYPYAENTQGGGGATLQGWLLVYFQSLPINLTRFINTNVLQISRNLVLQKFMNIVTYPQRHTIAYSPSALSVEDYAAAEKPLKFKVIKYILNRRRIMPFSAPAWGNKLWDAVSCIKKTSNLKVTGPRAEALAAVMSAADTGDSSSRIWMKMTRCWCDRR